MALPGIATGPYRHIVYRDVKSGLPTHPLPWQLSFHRSKARGRFAGGAWGCGKSYALMIDAAQYLTNPAYPKAQVRVMRKYLKDVEETTMRVLALFVLGVEEFDREALEESPLVRQVNMQKHFIIFENTGSRLVWGGSQTSKGRKAGGASGTWLDRIYYDEMTEFNFEDFEYWDGRLRGHTGDATNTLGWAAATNPHPGWCYEYFHPDSRKQFDNVDFFQTRSADNFHLPKGYVDSLRRNYPEIWVARMLEGSWKVFEGQIYTEFDARQHADIFDVPAPGGYKEEWAVLDFGFRNPTAVLFSGLTGDGVLEVYHEHFRAGLRPDEHAKFIKPILEARGIDYVLADPSCWRRESDGVSVAQRYEEQGINLVPANNEVRAGILTIKEWFEEGRIRFRKNCENTIREHEGYRWADLNPTMADRLDLPEEPIKKDDHTCDCMRYLINAIRGVDNSTPDRIGKTPEEVYAEERLRVLESVGVDIGERMEGNVVSPMCTFDCESGLYVPDRRLVLAA